MPPSHHLQGKCHHLTTISIMLLLALTAVASPNHNDNKAGTMMAAENRLDQEELSDNTLERRQQMSVGSSCAGSEGQWNCMSSSFQRCGSGRWSDVQQCALGTQCSPSGLTFQFHVDFADGYLGAAPPQSPPQSSSPPTISKGVVCIKSDLIAWWWLLWFSSGWGLMAVLV
ncbi:hypothetical protein F4808DRAFT_392626 [Astrocystis sublimbata]|nr:hypothetical protein F4808DRAFT_392626 [Astrocystis sublimbata]